MSHREAPKIGSAFTGVWGYTVFVCFNAKLKSHCAVFYCYVPHEAQGSVVARENDRWAGKRRNGNILYLT